MINYSLLTTLVLFFLIFCGPRAAPGLAANSSVVELVPFGLDSKNPERRNFGSLILLSAFQLKSSDSRFGGLSGLAVGADKKLYAVSDRGHWFSARMTFNPEGRLLDLSDWEIAPLLSPDGTAVTGRYRDAEALARSPDGSFIVAFEHTHRLWRYSAPPNTFTSRPTPIRLPREISKAPANGGVEGITFLPDGSLLALTEEFRNGDGSFKGWLIDDGRFAELSYQPSDGFRVTDCAALKNGDVLVLERSYALIGILRARLKLVPGKSVRAGAKLIGKEILQLEAPLAIDNFEGLAVQEDQSRGTILYLISDDNFNPFQSTLLLQFLLPNIDD
jgi:hypothetical protein